MFFFSISSYRPDQKNMVLLNLVTSELLSPLIQVLQSFHLLNSLNLIIICDNHGSSPRLTLGSFIISIAIYVTLRRTRKIGDGRQESSVAQFIVLFGVEQVFTERKRMCSNCVDFVLMFRSKLFIAQIILYENDYACFNSRTMFST